MICPRPDCDCCADNYVMFDDGYDRGDYTQVRPCPAYPLGCWPSDADLEEAMQEAREGRRVSALIKRWEASQSIQQTSGDESKTGPHGPFEVVGVKVHSADKRPLVAEKSEGRSDGND